MDMLRRRLTCLILGHQWDTVPVVVSGHWMDLWYCLRCYRERLHKRGEKDGEV